MLLTLIMTMYMCSGTLPYQSGGRHTVAVEVKWGERVHIKKEEGERKKEDNMKRVSHYAQNNRNILVLRGKPSYVRT